MKNMWFCKKGIMTEFKLLIKADQTTNVKV